ncbi:MAG: tetratricopeptide repeat protein, partial [Armatimonadetes bacterium]|nr:tetratricopeptide repeat protein [Armatimonadota bacterium]
PYAPALVRHLAACLIDERRYDEALAVLEHAQGVYPDYVDLRYLRGLALNRLGRYEEALEVLRECLRLGDSPSVYMFSQIGAGSFLARAASVESYLGLGRLDEAIEAQNAAAKGMSERLGGLVPALADAGRGVLGLWVRAEEHLRGGRLREAVTAYRQLLSAEVRQAFFTTQLAQLCPRKAVIELVAGEARLARQDLDLLAGVNPRAARGARLLLEPWLTPGGEAGAGENTGSEETPAGEDSRLGWRDVASVLVTLLDVGRRDWFERACDRLRSGLMDPGQLDRELGKLYFQRGLHERAAAHLLAGVQQGCTDSTALRALGEISLARGLHAEARTFLREAVRQRPADASAWVSLALSYHRLGRDRAGLRVLELARRYTGGEAIHTARLALSIRLQLAGRDGRNGPTDIRNQVAGEVS